MNIVSLIINAIRNRIMPIFIRFRLFTNPAYIFGRLTEFVRVFFTKLLNIRPKDKDDYYPVAKWLVSKRLAYAVVVILGALCLVYIFTSGSALLPGRSNNHIKTYDYNSILLKFVNDKVRIRGKSGYLAYEGDVQKAACNGSGTLMNPAGVVVYEGNFAANMYEGDGKKYYEDGTKEYEGVFHQNQFSGQGKLYRETGSLEYDGMFSQNMKDGKGILYDKGGNPIYDGEFSLNEIVYPSMLQKKSSEMAQIYPGKDRKLYVDGNESIRFCKAINVMTDEMTDPKSIDSESVVQAVFVIRNAIHIAGKKYQSFSDLESVLGAATYTGESYATLPELLAINYLNENSDMDVLNGPAQITMTDEFTEYTEVSGYEENYVVWLHSYEKDGLVYNFVSDKDDKEFLFYYILNSDLSDEK